MQHTHPAHQQHISTATLAIVLFATFSVCTLAAVLLRTISTQLDSSHSSSAIHAPAPTHAADLDQSDTLSSL